MDMFKNEREMLEELDHFIFKMKGLQTSDLRNKLQGKINKFIVEHGLDTDPHNFIDKFKGDPGCPRCGGSGRE